MLTVSELDFFLTEFLRICSLPVDEPVTEDKDLLLDDIYLPNKMRFFEETLAAYQTRIRRARKMGQTVHLTQLKKKQERAHFEVNPLSCYIY